MKIPIVQKFIDMRQRSLNNMILAPTGHLGISRDCMPQIEGSYREEFIKYIKDCGIKVRNIRIPIKSIRLIQGQYDRDKVALMIQQKRVPPPIFISNDGYVIDGNHTLIAELNRPEKPNYINVIELGMEAKPLLAVIDDFPRVKYRNLNGELKV